VKAIIIILPIFMALCITTGVILVRGARLREERTQEAYLEAYLATPFQDFFTDIPAGVREMIDLSDSIALLYNRGFTQTVEVSFSGLDLVFHFLEGINPRSVSIRETIQRYINVFYEARNAFPGRENSFVIYIDREQIQPRRVRTTLTPLPNGMLISEDLFVNSVNVNGYLSSLYFRCALSRNLPAWLSSGIEDYLMGNGYARVLSDNELQQWLDTYTNGDNPSFGDFWFIRSFVDDYMYESARNVAYNLVRRWADAGLLHEKIDISRDNYVLHEALKANLGIERNTDEHLYFYNFADVEVSTAQGRYIFKARHRDGWALERVHELVVYMDAGSIFLRDFLHVTDEKRAVMHIYPYSIPGVNYGFQGWEYSHLLRYGFAFGNIVALGNASDMYFIHELAHVYTMRIARPPTWVEEGMAILSEIAWFRSEINPRPRYRISSVGLSYMVMRNQGAPLPPYLVSRSSPYANVFRTYEDGASFVNFLYISFGMEKLLEFYAHANNRDNSSLAEDIFDYTMDELIYNWQLHVLSEIEEFQYRRQCWWRVCLEDVR